ncbi:MAG: hypothetical protein JWO50_320 [Candidatus Kaiserbacteria bacterium]|nr:hypothetical protein [Candidatus Kaiserbacteria bacterium]
MSSNQGNRFTRLGIVVFFIAAVAYGLFEARWVLLGPTITIFSDMSPTTSAFIRIQGRADHINTASLNGMPLTVTETGIFDEGYALVPGINQLYFDATDRYGHMAHTRAVIVYTPPQSTATLNTGTTTHAFLTIPVATTSGTTSIKTATTTQPANVATTSKAQ